jgi:hypothetical protein
MGTTASAVVPLHLPVLATIPGGNPAQAYLAADTVSAGKSWLLTQIHTSIEA